MKTRAILAAFFLSASLGAFADETITSVESKDFKTLVLSSKKPVLVDFFATWCVPCKKMAPEVEEAAKKYGDKISVYKLDIDKSPDVAKEYSIEGVPTMMIFKHGKVVDSITGLVPLTVLTGKIDKSLN